MVVLKKHSLLAMMLGMILGTVLFLTASQVRAQGLYADLVVYNGKILTLDSADPNNFRTAQAAAIYRGEFVAVGTNDEVLPYAGLNTRKIDVAGRMVLPGIVEKLRSLTRTPARV